MPANQLSPVSPALSSFDLLGEIHSDSETPVGAAFEAEAFVESLASFERDNDNHRARVCRPTQITHHRLHEQHSIAAASQLRADDHIGNVEIKGAIADNAREPKKLTFPAQAH